MQTTPEENIEPAFRRCLNRIAEGIVILDRKGILIYANKALANIVQKPVETIIKTPFSGLIAPEDHAITETIIRNRSTGTIHLLTKTTPVSTTLSAESNESTELDTVCLVITPDHSELESRKPFSEKLNHRILIENINKEIITLFTGIYDFDENINATLEKLGTITGADRSYVFLLSVDQAYLDNTHEWCANGVTPEKDTNQHLPSDLFPWWMKKLRNGEIIHISDVSHLPTEASAERKIIVEQGVKSFLVIPLFTDEKLEGFIGLDNVCETGTWSEDDIYLLASSAGIIGKALELKKREEEVARLTSFQEKIIDDPEIWVAGSTIDGDVIIWNKGAENITGYTKNEVVGSGGIWGKLSPDPEKRPDVAKIISDLSEGGKGPLRFPFPLITKNNEERYLTLSLRTLTDGRGKPFAIFGIGIDTTEQKLAEEEVLRTHRQLTNIIDFLPDGTWVVDREGTVIAWNRALEKITGVPKKKILGKGNHAYSIPFYSKKRPVLLDYVLGKKERPSTDYQNITESGDKLSGELFLPTVNNGKGGYFLATASPLYNDDGIIDGAIESLRDISDLKATEDALRQSEELFRTITTAALDAIIMIDEKGRIVLWNGAAETILGYTASEATGLDLHELILPEEYQEASSGGFDHFVKTGTGQMIGKTIDLKAKQKDGMIIPVELSLSAIQMHGNWHAVGILRDITERKKAEETLQQSEQRLNIALNSARLGGWDWDISTGEIIFDNRWGQILGYNPESFPKTIHDFYALVQKDDQEKLKKSLEDFFGTKNLYYHATIRAKSSEGTWRWIRTYGTVVERSSTGTPLRMIGLHQNVDRVVRSEEALKKTNKKLSLLSSITRHDILNQVGVLLIYSDLLKENVSATDLEDAEYLHAILDATRTIERQITFTRDYEDLGLTAPVWQDVAEIATKVSTEFHPEGITIVNRCRPGLEILADPMLNKVLFNLVENAVRHGKTLTTITISEEKIGNNCTIIVQDDGVGVPEGIKQKIFERGVGSHTGYGLFLSQEILAITNITIIENGTPGKGARFEIQIPPEGFRIIPPQ